MSRQMTTTITLIFLVLSLTFLSLFMKSQAKFNQAEDEAVRLVGYDYKIRRVNDFYWATTDETYFSLDFIDQEHQERYAIISQDGGEVRYYDKDEFITAHEAQAITSQDLEVTKFLQTRLALLNNEPVWEVTIKNQNGLLAYYYLNAMTGEWIKKIENI